MELIPKYINSIMIFVKIEDPKDTQTPTLVNAVDARTGELVYSWLFIIEPVM